MKRPSQADGLQEDDRPSGGSFKRSCSIGVGPSEGAVPPQQELEPAVVALAEGLASSLGPRWSCAPHASWCDSTAIDRRAGVGWSATHAAGTPLERKCVVRRM